MYTIKWNISIKCVNRGWRLSIAFVEPQVCSAGHGPVSQPTHLPQVQLSHSGVMGAGGRSHSVWLPHLGSTPASAKMTFTHLAKVAAVTRL